MRTELVGIEGLTTYDDYGDPQQTQFAHRRDYQGKPINAVVVHRWDNRLPATDGTVYLTNGPVTDPFVVFDTYDWRSVIENGIFHLAELAVLTRMRLHRLPSHFGSPQMILRRYGISP